MYLGNIIKISSNLLVLQATEKSVVGRYTFIGVFLFRNVLSSEIRHFLAHNYYSININILLNKPQEKR